MPKTYSTYEAKAKFSEILRKVRAGQRVTISYHGRAVAEIRPLGPASSSLEASLQRLEEEGVVIAAQKAPSSFKSLARKPGALKRFLESRE